jgi:glucose-6-phosphate 1-dehydrogenase
VFRMWSARVAATEYTRSFLPKTFTLVGYARSPLTDQQLRERLKPFLSGPDELMDEFLSRCQYCQGEVRSLSR